MRELIFFTTQQGTALLLLLIAHLLADFVFQSKSMANNKSWLSWSMFFHVLIVFVLTYFFTGSFWVTLVVAISHYVIDSIKHTVQSKYPTFNESWIFILDQLTHLFVLIGIWILNQKIANEFIRLLTTSMKNYRLLVCVFAYLFLMYPVGYIIGYSTKGLNNSSITVTPNNEIENGGRRIGFYERIIILTLVLLSQYEAIGFLITGKSIIRFVNHREVIKSEYVLVGTMMSYGFSIVVGVLTNWLLSLIA